MISLSLKWRLTWRCLTSLKLQSYITDIDDCAGVTCLNGGSCVDGVNSFTCRCDVGYTGTHCEQSKLLDKSTILFISQRQRHIEKWPTVTVGKQKSLITLCHCCLKPCDSFPEN